jgi:hypothetical protein
MHHPRYLIALGLCAALIAGGCGNHRRTNRQPSNTAAPVTATGAQAPVTTATAPTSSAAAPPSTSAGSGAITSVNTSVGSTASTSSATSSAASVGTTSPGSTSAIGCVNPGDDHGEDWSTATLVDDRSPFHGAVEVACDGDGFVVFLRAGTPYDLLTETQDDTTLTVLDASGFPVAFNDNADQNTLASRVRGLVPANDGDYLVLIHTFGGARADYTLRVFPTGVLTMPRLAAAELYDTDGSRSASSGDVLILTYTEPLVASSFGAPTPGSELILPVSGDSLGLGATLALGSRTDQVRVVLGQSPALTVAGRYGGNQPLPGSPSGFDVSFLSQLSSAATGFPVARWAVDLTWGVGSPP